MSAAVVSFFWPFGAVTHLVAILDTIHPISAKCCLQHTDEAPIKDALIAAPAKDTQPRDTSPAPPPATPSLPSDAGSDQPGADTPGSHPLKRQVEFEPQVEQVVAIEPPAEAAAPVEAPAKASEGGACVACCWRTHDN